MLVVLRAAHQQRAHALLRHRQHRSVSLWMSFSKSTPNADLSESPGDVSAAYGQKEFCVDKDCALGLHGPDATGQLRRDVEAATRALILAFIPPHSLHGVWLKPVLWIQYAGESASGGRGPR